MKLTKIIPATSVSSCLPAFWALSSWASSSLWCPLSQSYSIMCIMGYWRDLQVSHIWPVCVQVGGIPAMCPRMGMQLYVLPSGGRLWRLFQDRQDIELDKCLEYTAKCTAESCRMVILGSPTDDTIWCFTSGNTLWMMEGETERESE